MDLIRYVLGNHSHGKGITLYDREEREFISHIGRDKPSLSLSLSCLFWSSWATAWGMVMSSELNIIFIAILQTLRSPWNQTWFRAWSAVSHIRGLTLTSFLTRSLALEEISVHLPLPIWGCDGEGFFIQVVHYQQVTTEKLVQENSKRPAVWLDIIGLTSKIKEDFWYHNNFSSCTGNNNNYNNNNFTENLPTWLQSLFWVEKTSDKLKSMILIQEVEEVEDNKMLESFRSRWQIFWLWMYAIAWQIW